jgi:heat shock factor-binding protein 1
MCSSLPLILYSFSTKSFLLHAGVEHANAFFRESRIQFGVSVKAYAILISGLAIVVKPEKAQKLLDEMIERGVEPGVPTYIVQINSLCRGGVLHLCRSS